MPDFLTGKEMLTYPGGKIIHLTSFRVQDVNIVDIAHHLSLECRWAGAVPFHYSVAQHCVEGLAICPSDLELLWLLHDAAEAYTKDIPTYMKNIFPELRKFEYHIHAVILEALEVAAPTDEQLLKIKRVDEIMFSTELRDLHKREDLVRLPAFESIKIRAWDQDHVAKAFLNAYRILKEGELLWSDE